MNRPRILAEIEDLIADVVRRTREERSRRELRKRSLEGVLAALNSTTELSVLLADKNRELDRLTQERDELAREVEAAEARRRVRRARATEAAFTRCRRLLEIEEEEGSRNWIDPELEGCSQEGLEEERLALEEELRSRLAVCEEVLEALAALARERPEGATRLRREGLDPWLTAARSETAWDLPLDVLQEVRDGSEAS